MVECYSDIVEAVSSILTGRTMKENPNFEFDKGEIESAELSLKSDRGLESYIRYLRISEEDLEGKKILDLGSGPNSNFAKDVEEQIKETEVVSVDYTFEDEDDIENQKQTIEEKDNDDLKQVKALFSKLPFKDNSFDIVVSAFAMPFYLQDKERIEKAIEEIIRVLENGGKAILGPVRHTELIGRNSDAAWPSENFTQKSYEETVKLLKPILKKHKKQVTYTFKDPIIADYAGSLKYREDPGVLNIMKHRSE